METKNIHQKINVRANAVQYARVNGFSISQNILVGKPYRRDFDLWKTSPFVIYGAYGFNNGIN